MAAGKQSKRKQEQKLPESVKKHIEEMAAYYKPRPKERIPEILDAIKELWELEPDTRLGQLLLNFIYRGGDPKEKTNYKMYEQEDTLTLDIIRAKLKELRKQEKYSRPNA